MAMKTCPHCGGQLRVETLISAVKGRTSRHHNKFEQVARLAPMGYFGSFVWRVIFNRPLVAPAPVPDHVIVRIEEQVTPQRVLLKELKIPATPQQIGELAQIYCDRPSGLGYSWSRETTKSQLRWSQPRHDKIAAAFRKSGFLVVSRGTEDRPTEYQLTVAGKRFLRHYLPPTLKGVVDEKLDPVNKQ